MDDCGVSEMVDVPRSLALRFCVALFDCFADSLTNNKNKFEKYITETER